MEEVDKVFSGFEKAKRNLFVAVQIDKTKLLKTGEVPQTWLKEYRDLKTWADFNFQCDASHCDQRFDDLYSYYLHIRKNRLDHEITCFLCPKTFRFSNYSFLPAYINHLTRAHLPFIKFCCIICSKVFLNMPLLSRHYQTEHTHDVLKLFPCLDCGFYSQAMGQLKQHVRDKHK